MAYVDEAADLAFEGMANGHGGAASVAEGRHVQWLKVVPEAYVVKPLVSGEVGPVWAVWDGGEPSAGLAVVLIMALHCVDSLPVLGEEGLFPFNSCRFCPCPGLVDEALVEMELEADVLVKHGVNEVVGRFVQGGEDEGGRGDWVADASVAALHTVA